MASSVYHYDFWNFSDWPALPANRVIGSMSLDRLALMEKANGVLDKRRYFVQWCSVN
ncbi:MAG: hypothetical protein ACOYL3_14605 [Desulfuromonadaceae bacterium]